MNYVRTEDAISALLRKDFGFFLRMVFAELGGDSAYVHGWHIDAIIQELDRVRIGTNRRLIVTIPPRHLKTRTITIAWVCWMMGHNPALAIMCVSYGQDLAEEHGRECLKIFRSRWFRRAFPSFTLTRSTPASIETSAGGQRMATSIDGAITGFGADIIVLDDPMKTQDFMSPAAREKIVQWFDGTLAQRLNDQLSGSVVLVMQRLHEGDLAGVLKERGTWHELCLSAIATKDEAIPLTRGRVYQRREGHALHPARQPLSFLHEKRRANSFIFESQFQQAPVPPHGNLVKPEWLGQFDPGTLDLTKGEIVQSWDTASKDNPFSDWSVCITARVLGRSVQVIDVFRARLTFPKLKARAIELARVHGADVMLIEDASSGMQLIQMLQSEEPDGVPWPIRRRPETDKISRAMAASAMIEAGQLSLPVTAHWIADFTREVTGFPAAPNDDQMDALTQLLLWVQERNSWADDDEIGDPELIDMDLTPDRAAPPIQLEYPDDPWL